MLGVTAILGAAMLVASADASAQSRVRLVPDVGLVCVEYMDCETGMICEGGDVCVYVDAYESSVCTTPSGPRQDIACCNPDHDTPCPDLGSGTGRCVALATDFDICVYRDDPRLECVEAASAGEPRLTTLESCFTDPATGAPTRDWLAGDCDRDGVKNGAEPGGCLCNPEDGCGEVPDAGVVEPDAGPDEDAGVVEPDAGPEEDAGRPESDAGANMDGGGSGEEDPLQGIDFRGSGGCSCDGAAGGSGVPPAAALAVILGAALARRRR